MTILFQRKKIVFGLSLIAFLLVLIHSIVLAIYFYVDDTQKFDFIRLVDLDYEGNIPTLFSALLFLINAGLLYLIYCSNQTEEKTKGEKNHARYWLGLAIVFTFLGFDEGSRLHEEIGDLLEHFLDAKGLLFFPWIIPYSIAMIIAFLIYWRFYLALDRDLQIRLLLCATIFLTGALGIEMLSAKEADLHSTSSLTYSLLYTLEESLEMIGLILFIDTLLRHLKQKNADIKLKIF